MEHSLYLIAPVGSDPQFSKKRAILEELAEKRDVAVHFPMDKVVSVPGTPMSSIPALELAELLRRSSLIIADLSFERPSCYYELGVAQLIRSDVVMIAEAGTDIHQAEGRSKVRFYRDLDQYRDLMEQVVKFS